LTRRFRQTSEAQAGSDAAADLGDVPGEPQGQEQEAVRQKESPGLVG